MTKVAAVDIGTNSVRLLVADAGVGRDAKLTAIDRQTRITRLGQGVNEPAGSIPTRSSAPSLALREYHEVVAAHEITRVRMTATSASRDAPTATTSSTRSSRCSVSGPSC